MNKKTITMIMIMITTFIVRLYGCVTRSL